VSYEESKEERGRQDYDLSFETKLTRRGIVLRFKIGVTKITLYCVYTSMMQSDQYDQCDQ